MRAGGMEGAIILGLTSLDLLGAMVVVDRASVMSASKYDDLKAAGKLTKLLETIKVPPAIPARLSNLTAFAAANRWPDAATALAEIRHGWCIPTASAKHRAGRVQSRNFRNVAALAVVSGTSPSLLSQPSRPGPKTGSPPNGSARWRKCRGLRPWEESLQMRTNCAGIMALNCVRICANEVVAGVHASTLLPGIRPVNTRRFTSAQQINQLEGLAVAIPSGFKSPLPHSPVHYVM